MFHRGVEFSKKMLIFWLIDWLMFNVKWAVFQNTIIHVGKKVMALR
jgi:hypothetical protein